MMAALHFLKDALDVLGNLTILCIAVVFIREEFFA